MINWGSIFKLALAYIFCWLALQQLMPGRKAISVTCFLLASILLVIMALKKNGKKL
jgi:hypothetical protein